MTDGIGAWAKRLETEKEKIDVADDVSYVIDLMVRNRGSLEELAIKITEYFRESPLDEGD